MSGMLASVRSLEEAEIVFKAGVDIIDLKEPEQGALGAVSHETARNVVERFQHQVTISATIGDLPVDAEMIDQAITQMAATGVDIVKVGLFANHICNDLLRIFQQHNAAGRKLVLVFFADQDIDLAKQLSKLDNSIVYGVMLDTATKANGSLLTHRTIDELLHFVELAKDKQLLTGLAGSLAVNDIDRLLPLNSHYLGFRGALCKQADRVSSLDELSLYRVRTKLSKNEKLSQKEQRRMN